MPEETSSQKGAAAELRAAARLVSLGCQVFLPTEHSHTTDFVYKLDGAYMSVQVKSGPESPVPEPNFRMRVRYARDAFDVLIVSSKDRVWSIPWAEVHGKPQFRLKKEWLL
jgi:hypothetical protein